MKTVHLLKHLLALACLLAPCPGFAQVTANLPEAGKEVRSLYQTGKIEQADELVCELAEKEAQLGFSFEDFTKPGRKTGEVEQGPGRLKLAWALDTPTAAEAVVRLERLREEAYDIEFGSFLMEDAPHWRDVTGALLELLRYYMVTKNYRKADGILIDLDDLSLFDPEEE